MISDIGLYNIDLSVICPHRCKAVSTCSLSLHLKTSAVYLVNNLLLEQMGSPNPLGDAFTSHGTICQKTQILVIFFFLGWMRNEDRSRVPNPRQ